MGGGGDRAVHVSQTFLLPFHDSAFPNLVNSSRLNRSGVGVCTCTSFQCHNTPHLASHEVITINVVYRVKQIQCFPTRCHYSKGCLQTGRFCASVDIKSSIHHMF